MENPYRQNMNHTRRKKIKIDDARSSYTQSCSPTDNSKHFFNLKENSKKYAYLSVN